MVEQWAFNPLVQGSSPWGRTGETLRRRARRGAEVTDCSRCWSFVTHGCHRLGRDPPIRPTGHARHLAKNADVLELSKHVRRPSAGHPKLVTHTLSGDHRACQQVINPRQTVRVGRTPNPRSHASPYLGKIQLYIPFGWTSALSSNFSCTSKLRLVGNEYAV